MLSRFFNQQVLSIFIVVFLLVSIGCASKTVDLARSQDHPADPNGKHGTTPTHGSMPTAEMHEGDEGHSSTELSSAGMEALTTMLDAYLAIGEQLASDTMDNVSAKAHAMIEAFHTVEGEVPAELWNAHKVHTKMIYDTGHELGDLSDIKAARIAYGSLSIVSSTLLRLWVCLQITRSPSTATCAGWCPMYLKGGFGCKPASPFATHISEVRCSDATVQKRRCLSQVRIYLVTKTWNRTSIAINTGEELDK